MDTKNILGQVAGPAGYVIASIATGQQEFTLESGDENAPAAIKLAQDLMGYVEKAKFGADVEDVADAAEDAVNAADKVAVGGTTEDLIDAKGTNTKKYSFWDWLVFGMTIIALLTSFTLNNNVEVRAKMGYSGTSATAGIFMTFLSIVFIFMFGPWVYFTLLLLQPIMQGLPGFKTANGVYWIEGIKRAAADPAIPSEKKFLVKYLSMMPQFFESKTPAAPAQFGNFYY